MNKPRPTQVLTTGSVPPKLKLTAPPGNQIPTSLQWPTSPSKQRSSSTISSSSTIASSKLKPPTTSLLSANPQAAVRPVWDASGVGKYPEEMFLHLVREWVHAIEQNQVTKEDHEKYLTGISWKSASKGVRTLRALTDHEMAMVKEAAKTGCYAREPSGPAYEVAKRICAEAVKKAWLDRLDPTHR